MTAGPLAALVAGLAVLLGARLFVFRAGAALADAGEPGLGKSLLLAVTALGLTAGLVALLWAPAGRLDGDPSGFGPMRGLGVALAVAVAAAASGLLYKAALPTSARKGLLMAGYEVALGALLAALAAGVVLVVAAVIQRARRPEPPPRADAPAPLARPAPLAEPS